jgi:hypothetical protein
MRDALGNELKIGDLVAVQLARPLIYGQVVEASEGGIVTGINHKGSAEMRPGRIVIVSRHIVDFDPRVQIDSLLALRNDNASAEDVHGKPSETLPN